MDNFDTQTSEFKQMIKHIIWTCESFHLPADRALKYINSGILGYKTSKDNTIKIDKNTGKPTPITISRRTYFRYKKKFLELPQIYQDLRDFVMKGYIELLVGFYHELAYLHRLSAENLFATKEPLERQHIIDSMVSKVIPAESAFVDILKYIVQDDILPKYKE